MRSAMNRLGGWDLAEMQALSFHADGASKGLMQGEPWSLLERLVVVMALSNSIYSEHGDAREVLLPRRRQ